MVSKAKWNNLYINNSENLPWLNSEIPVDLLQKFTELLPANRQVLDFGCGNGRMAELLKKMDCIVDCYDISEAAIELCKKKTGGTMNSYISKIEELTPKFYDGIICWAVIHHISLIDWESFLNSLIGLIKKNGIILLAGFDKEDKQHKISGKRISPTTGLVTHPLIFDHCENIFDPLNLRILQADKIIIKEYQRNNNRIFISFLLKH